MNNNTFNEISTNESPTQSPSKNLRHIGQKDIKHHFTNFSSFLSSLNKDSVEKILFSPENLNNLNKETVENIELKEKPEIKRRIIKKIIKKKVRNKHLLLDFDFILKELFNKNNSKNDTSNLDVPPFREIVNKKILGKKRKKALKKFISPLNRKENGKKLKLNII